MVYVYYIVHFYNILLVILLLFSILPSSLSTLLRSIFEHHTANRGMAVRYLVLVSTWTLLGDQDKVNMAALYLYTIPNNRRVGTGSQQTSSGWNSVWNRFQQQRVPTGGMARVLLWLRYGHRGWYNQFQVNEHMFAFIIV